MHVGKMAIVGVLASSSLCLAAESGEEAAQRLGLNFPKGPRWQFTSKAVLYLNKSLQNPDEQSGTFFSLFGVGFAEAHCDLSLDKASQKVSANDTWSIVDVGAAKPSGYMGRPTNFVKTYTLLSKRGDKIHMSCMYDSEQKKAISISEERDLKVVLPETPDTSGDAVDGRK